MSDKPEKKKESAPAEGDHGEKPKKGGGLLAKTPVILAAVMVIEAVVLFAGFKFVLGGPKTAHADIPTEKTDDAADGSKDEEKPKEGEKKEGKEGEEKKPTGEVLLVEMRAPNKVSGRTFLYDVTIVVATKPSKSKKLQDAISAHDALIKDRVRTIIGEMDPEKLGGGSEPGLETLRRQVKFQLDKILGEKAVDEVLVPKCIPFRTEY